MVLLRKGKMMRKCGVGIRLAEGIVGTHLHRPLKSGGSWRSQTADAKEGEDDDVEMVDPRMLPADYDPSSFDPTEHRSPPTQRVFRLVDEIATLTLLEVAELSSIIRKRLNMTDGPTIAVMKPGTRKEEATSPSKQEDKKPEKTIFDLKLDAYDAVSKIKIIKEIRTFTDLGLKEAKDLVEKTPVVIKKSLSKEEADLIIQKMKAIGASVSME